MDSGYYAALTGLVARTQAMDTVAANLANAQTPGYRAEREYFRSALMGPDAADSQLGQVVNNYGLLGGSALNLQQGSLIATGNPLDIAIDGRGFFAIQTQNGVRYTRDGSFHRTGDGHLVTKAGDAVLDTQGKPVVIPPGEVSIGESGIISVAGGAVTNLAVYDFSSAAQLKPDGANLYAATEPKAAKAINTPSIHQGNLEGANEDIVQGSLDLLMMQRQAEMMQKAVTLFHADFNKFATEDLPRV